MRRLICKLIGHDDTNRTPGVRHSAPLMECKRCGRVGWLV